MQKRGYQIIELPGSAPNPYEKRVARALAEYFQSDVVFLPEGAAASPDIQVLRYRQIWEIKNIAGNSENTIGHNISNAKYQSQNLVLSLYRTKMLPRRAIGYAKKELQHRPYIKRLLIITKKDEVIKLK